MTAAASRRATVPAGEPDAVQRRHLVSALVVDRPGTLNRVSGLLRARSFNIESLTVGATHEPGLSRMTIAIRGDEGHLRQVLAQLERVIDVLDVTDLAGTPHVELELALVELEAPVGADREQAVRRAVANAGGQSLATDASGWRFQLIASPDRLDGVLDELRGLGLRRLVRAGAVAMTTTPNPSTNGATPA